MEGTSQAPTHVKKSSFNDYPIGYRWSTPDKNLYLEIPKSTEKLVACGQFDWRGGDNIKEKIHFRSEVVVKDENHGWAMWNGLSSNPSSTPNKVDFEYRLLTFKKTGNTWSIDRGFGWSTPTSVQSPNKNKLVVKLPGTNTFQVTNDQGYSQRKTWSGVAKLDANSKHHLVESLSIYMTQENGTTTYDAHDAEFFGLEGGKWVHESQGYNKANRVYVKDRGWQTMNALDLKESLTAWYKPLAGETGVGKVKRNVGWMTCEQWANGTEQNTSSWESTMKDMCYSN